MLHDIRQRVDGCRPTFFGDFLSYSLGAVLHAWRVLHAWHGQDTAQCLEPSVAFLGVDGAQPEDSFPRHNPEFPDPVRARNAACAHLINSCELNRPCRVRAVFVFGVLQLARMITTSVDVQREPAAFPIGNYATLLSGILASRMLAK